MTQRCNLFSAGFCANVPALYYQQHELVHQHGLLSDQRLKSHADKVFSKLREKEDEQLSVLQNALKVAREFEVPAPDLPKNSAEYFDWFQAFVEAFEKCFPMSRIDHYYFLFGRKVSEIIVNLGLATCCLDFQLAVDNELDLTRKTDKCIKDNEYILFRLIAPAALLSSEPRQNFFNVYYRSMNAAFEPFRGIDVKALSKDDMRKLSDGLRSFEQMVAKGYKDCEDQLRELGF